MNLQCANCYRTSDAYLCASCGDLLAKELRTVGWVSDELDVTLSRQDRIGAQQGGHRPGKDVERPLPLHLGASEAAWILHDVLASTARDIAEQRGFPLDCVDTSPAIAAWLVRHVDAIRHDPGGGQTYDKVTDAIASARRIIDAPAGRMFAGPCGSETDAGRCGADLYAAIDAPSVSCQECGAKWDVGERRADLLEQARSRLASAPECERMLPWFVGSPIRATRIRQWASRGRIMAKGADLAGVPLYRIGDVVDLHNRTTTERASA